MGKKDIIKPPKNVTQIHKLTLVEQAMSANAPIETLKEIMALQERQEANEARKAFTKAMNDFKANAPTLVKDCKVSYGKTAYSHESLAYICESLIPSMSKYGLSHRWDLEQNENKVTVINVITHELGHSQSTPLSSEPDNSGGKNSIQAIGSAVKYLQRYTFLSAVGMAAGEKDDDGRGSEPQQYITAEQVAELENIIKTDERDREAFVKYLQVESLSLLPAEKYNTAITALKAKS